MTKVIGLTGGIGSGKTLVANYIRSKGIPVYIADEEAKQLMQTPEIVKAIANTFGNKIMNGHQVNREELARLVFESPKMLQKLNEIIHPKVKQHFEDWLKKHYDYPFVVKEAAILFESGSYRFCDKIITVTAPLPVRLQRVMERDQISEEQVMNRIKNQWNDEKKVALSDFVIHNIAIENTKIQVDNILKTLKNN